ncbi:MAG: glycosyltransferase family 2 protein [Flavobacteriales bacterium]|nr:glycosyltransferase family 2 protein [Flavobacteriales bacterium]
MASSPGVQPLVSVLVCTYQHGPYIAACLESIKAQRTSFPIEVLVGEDGSTDGTGAECDRVVAGDPRFRVHHWGDGPRWRIEGCPTGRRSFMRLYAMARGRYVHFIDGDDGWLDPLKLQRQVDLLDADPGCIGSYHQTAVKDEEGRLMHPWRDPLPERMHLEQVVGLRAPFHPGSFLWRDTPIVRTLITSDGGWRAGSFDMWFFASAATQGHLRAVDGELSYYTRHGQGLSSQGLFVADQHPSAAHPAMAAARPADRWPVAGPPGRGVRPAPGPAGRRAHDRHRPTTLAAGPGPGPPLLPGSSALGPGAERGAHGAPGLTRIERQSRSFRPRR